MTKALFLDRDGTINVDTGYVYRIEDFKLIDGIVDLCLAAQQNDYLLIIITNQSGIARGYYSEHDYAQFTDHMLAELAKAGVRISDVFHCPHLDGEDRKPRPGMFLKAQHQYDIDMSASLSLGDKQRDIDAAELAGVGRNFLVPPCSHQSIIDQLSHRG